MVGDPITRRRVVGAGGGLVGLSVGGSAFAQGPSPQGPNEMTAPADPQNPIGKYPKPPFPSSHSPGRGLPARWIPPQITARKATKVLAASLGERPSSPAAIPAWAERRLSLCKGRRRCRDKLLSNRGAGRAKYALDKGCGPRGLALPGDIRDEAFCQKLVADAVNGLGGLDILVSNAGRQQAHDSILDISTEDFDATMKTNIYAPFWIIKAALPHLKPGSAIIGTTSEQAYDPYA